MVKNSVSNVRDITDECSIAWSGRSPGGGHGNALQYSCLEKPMDRGAWQATVHWVAKSWTQLKRLSMHATLPLSSWKSWLPDFVSQFLLR